MKRALFLTTFIILFVTEVIIGICASGWVRNYLGDVFIVILLYALTRLIILEKPTKWYVIPSIVLVFAFVVEFLQLWGFCDRFGITNRLLRIIIGTGFSSTDLLCYAVGIIPSYLFEYYGMIH